MKSLVTLLIYHLLFASLLAFIIVSGSLPIYDIVLVLVFLPALNKGLIYLKIDSQKTRILNLALFFMILSLPQLTVILSNWKYYLLFTINYRYSFFYHLSLLSLSIRKRKLSNIVHLGEIIHEKRRLNNSLTSKFLSYPRSL